MIYNLRRIIGKYDWVFFTLFKNFNNYINYTDICFDILDSFF